MYVLSPINTHNTTLNYTKRTDVRILAKAIPHRAIPTPRRTDIFSYNSLKMNQLFEELITPRSAPTDVRPLGYEGR